MKKEKRFDFVLWVIASVVWGLVFGFVLVDYFAPNIPSGVHFVAIWSLAGIQVTLTVLTNFFIKSYRVNFVE